MIVYKGFDIFLETYLLQMEWCETLRTDDRVTVWLCGVEKDGGGGKASLCGVGRCDEDERLELVGSEVAP